VRGVGAKRKRRAAVGFCLNFQILSIYYIYVKKIIN